MEPSKTTNLHPRPVRSGASLPIIFSADSVRAILSGRKTQTRRVIKPQPIGQLSTLRRAVRNGEVVMDYDVPVRRIPHGNWEPLSCPYGHPGAWKRLWVRETWADVRGLGIVDCHEEDASCVYKADHPWEEEWDGGWKPSRFMPRWASRLTLQVTDVTVERINNITITDIKTEGAPEFSGHLKYHEIGDDCYRNWFRDHWNALNATRGYPYEQSPWVWAVRFQRVEV